MIFATSELYPALNATAATDLDFWSDAELYQYAAEAAERLARAAGCFVTRTSATTTAGNRDYALPANHLAVLHVSAAGSSLRPSTVGELEALDSAWRTGAGTVSRFALDVAGLDTLSLYKIPAAPQALTIVHHSYPEVEAGVAIDSPQVLGDYLYFATLSAARGRDSRAAMPEVAGFAGQVAAVLEQAFTQYFGGSR